MQFSVLGSEIEPIVHIGGANFDNKPRKLTALRRACYAHMPYALQAHAGFLGLPISLRFKSQGRAGSMNVKAGELDP